MGGSQKATIFQRISARIETVILTCLVPLDNPGPIFRWIFRIPIIFYRLGLGALTPSFFLLLTTKGRRTGKLHQTPLEFTYEPEKNSYIIMAGWGGKTDWCRNVLADPHVHVQVGRKKFEALAEPLPKREVAEYMLSISARAPMMKQVFERWAGRPLQDSLTDYVEAASMFPSFRLYPQNI